MKKLIYLFSSLAILFSLTSCLKDSCTQTQEYRRFNPVMMTEDMIRQEIIPIFDRRLEAPGKIYFYKNYLLINEIGRGIHFYDMTNAKSPVKKVFYDLPGNFDMAIKDDILIADDALDIRSIDISDLLHPKTINRKLNYKGFQGNIPNMQHLAYYVASDITDVLDCSQGNFGQQFFNRGGALWANADVIGFGFSSAGALGNSGNNLVSAIGQGGSFARFAIKDDYLYVVNNTSLQTYKMDKGSFSETSNQQLGWGIETIFPYKDKLFIGSNAGMFIFDNSTPTRPQMLSNFSHARACDPVVVNENTAYVTLRNGNECNGFTNQMDVIDITNLNNPKLIKSYQMTHPHGLAISDKSLFLCEGIHGLKTLDIKDDAKIKEVAFDKSVKSYDVIALNDKRLLVIGEDGFYQYDATNPSKLILLSTIPISSK